MYVRLLQTSGPCFDCPHVCLPLGRCEILDHLVMTGRCCLTALPWQVSPAIIFVSVVLVQTMRLPLQSGLQVYHSLGLSNPNAVPPSFAG